MNLIALISFYNEHPAVLRDCIVGLARAGVDHVVCLDGAYALFPDAQAASPAEQHAAILLTAREVGVGLTLEVPRSHWVGNEVEKRDHHFRIANSVATPGRDWLWIMDADQVVRDAPRLKERLAETDRDVAATLLHDRVVEQIPMDARAPGMEEDFMLRNVFRAQPIRVMVNHYTFVTDDGRVLWGGPVEDHHVPAPCLDLVDVIVDHYPDRRDRERLQAKHAYYTRRDAEGVEMGLCERCRHPRAAARKVPVDLAKVTKRNRPLVVGSWAVLCEPHAREQEARNGRWLRARGFDPAKGAFENRNGNRQQLVGGRLAS